MGQLQSRLCDGHSLIIRGWNSPAVSDLYADGDIDVYQNTVESDMETEDICWSEYEERTAEEILSQMQEIN